MIKLSYNNNSIKRNDGFRIIWTFDKGLCILFRRVECKCKIISILYISIREAVLEHGLQENDIPCGNKNGNTENHTIEMYPYP